MKMIIHGHKQIKKNTCNFFLAFSAFKNQMVNVCGIAPYKNSQNEWIRLNNVM